MTGIATLGGRSVIFWLSVATGCGARPLHLVVINLFNRLPGGKRMARRTVQFELYADVANKWQVMTTGVGTTSGARGRNLIVVNFNRRTKGAGGVAQHTVGFGRNRNMRRGFTARALAIVTLDTLHAGQSFMVVEGGRRHPNHRAMTGRTVGGRR